MNEITLKAVPFSWNDEMAELALEEFEAIQKNLSYGTVQTIGTALAKLQLLEKQGAKVKGEQK